MCVLVSQEYFLTSFHNVFILWQFVDLRDVLLTVPNLRG